MDQKILDAINESSKKIDLSVATKEEIQEAAKIAKMVGVICIIDDDDNKLTVLLGDDALHSFDASPDLDDECNRGIIESMIEDCVSEAIISMRKIPEKESILSDCQESLNRAFRVYNKSEAVYDLIADIFDNEYAMDEEESLCCEENFSDFLDMLSEVTISGYGYFHKL